MNTVKRCPVCGTELTKKHYEDSGDWLVCLSCGKSRQLYTLKEPWAGLAPWKREAVLRNALAAAGYALNTVYRSAEMITDNLKHVDGPGQGMIATHAEEQRLNIAHRLDVIEVILAAIEAEKDAQHIEGEASFGGVQDES